MCQISCGKSLVPKHSFSASAEWHATAQALHTWTISYIHALLQRKRWTTCYSASAERHATAQALKNPKQRLHSTTYKSYSASATHQWATLKYYSLKRLSLPQGRKQIWFHLCVFPNVYHCFITVLISFWFRFYFVFIVFNFFYLVRSRVYLFASCFINCSYFVSVSISRYLFGGKDAIETRFAKGKFISPHLTAKSCYYFDMFAASLYLLSRRHMFSQLGPQLLQDKKQNIWQEDMRISMLEGELKHVSQSCVCVESRISVFSRQLFQA